jgi:hypothetical protein
MEALLRRAGREPGGSASSVLLQALGQAQVVSPLLLCLLAHSPEQQAAALAASLAKAVRLELGSPSAWSRAAMLFYDSLADFSRIMTVGQPSPALRQLAGLLAGVLCDVGPALCSSAALKYLNVQYPVVGCLHLTALLACHGTGAARAAWRAQLLSLKPLRLLRSVFEGGFQTLSAVFPATAACAVAAAVPEELRAAALQASRAHGKPDVTGCPAACLPQCQADHRCLSPLFCPMLMCAAAHCRRWYRLALSCRRVYRQQRTATRRRSGRRRSWRRACRSAARS